MIAKIKDKAENMKNITNYKAIFVFSLIILIGVFVAPSFSFAAASFNTDPLDYPTLQVGNLTTSPGCASCWKTSGSANGGEYLSFLVYYHNTSNETANQTKIIANVPSGSYSSQTVSVSIVSQNSGTINGSVGISAPSNQSLTFVSNSVKWFPSRNSAAQPLLYGQSGNEIVSEGLNIGDIVSGWSSQGYVIFSVLVGAGGSGSSANAPIVATNPATSIGQNYATLNGTVNSNNSNTTVWFEYGPTTSLGSTAGYQNIGISNFTTNISAYLSNIQPNLNFYYRIAAQNSYGTSYGSIMNFMTGTGYNYNYYSSGYGGGATVTTYNATSIGSNFATLNASVSSNYSGTTVWFEYGTNTSLGYTTGYQNIGTGTGVNLTASLSNLQSNTTYYYRAATQNYTGTSYGNIVSFTTPGYGSGYNYYGASGNYPYVTTNNVSYVYQNSALFSGSVNPNNSLTTAWFEWGTTNSLGNKTAEQPMGQDAVSHEFSFAASGLQADTIYHYRAVARNSLGTNYGNILNFTTRANSYVPVSKETQITFIKKSEISADKNIILEPSISDDNPDPGEGVNYSIIYKNKSSHSISNVVLKIALPSETQYLGSTIQPALITADNNLVFNLGTIDTESQAAINIKIKIKDAAEKNNVLIFNALLEYNNYKGTFQSISAFITAIISGNSLTASLENILKSLFSNWAFDLLLGLIIGYGIYHFFIKSKETDLV
ncbi:MAG: fibronectin type III domain-containing protein [Patescibacteria group bacterium]|nr:fibronectin type III domain-containing protein [Patescibacteria group bacterium]